MILNEKDKYEKMKYNLISENGDEKQETTKLSSIWSKNKWYKKHIYICIYIYKNVRDNKKELLQMRFRNHYWQ